MAITRYEPSFDGDGHPCIEDREFGDLVLYSDHLADREAYAKRKVEEAVGKIRLKTFETDEELGLSPLLPGEYANGLTDGRLSARSELEVAKAKVLKENAK